MNTNAENMAPYRQRFEMACDRVERMGCRSGDVTARFLMTVAADWRVLYNDLLYWAMSEFFVY